MPLTELALIGARISARGFADLKAALPHCQIDWSEPKRTAAEAVLALDGSLHVRIEEQTDERPVKSVRELPAAYFRVTRVTLTGVTKPLDTLFPKLAVLTDPKFDDLRTLDLSGRPTGNADLAALQPMPGLTELLLMRTLIDDTGLASLKIHKKLRRLVLDGCPFRGSWVGPLKELPSLTELHLGCSTLTDLSCRSLGELTKLERLSLAGSGIGDPGLKHLHGLTNLKDLDLRKTKVTAAGVTALGKALPQCKIVSDGTP